MGKVYIIEDELNRVKIGKSIDPIRRINEIRTKTGMQINRSYISINLENYSEIEHLILEKFKTRESIGEWVCAKYHDVVAFTDVLIENIGSLQEENEKPHEANLRTGNFIVDSIVKRKFDATCLFRGVSINQGIEEAMIIYIQRHLPELVENESLLKALS